MPGIGQSGATAAPHTDSLGVVISLPPSLAEVLGEKRAMYAGPGTAVVAPHITLVSGRAWESWTAAEEHVRKVAAEFVPFKLSLRGTGTFEPVSPVVFLNVDDGAADCAALHAKLLEGPLEHLLEFSFHPHLTIAHALDADTMARAKAEMVDFEAEFEVTSIGLFDYIEGTWALREELSLGGTTRT
ncbi:2'-5' RNA ligase family protein [Specibacter sp. NPDC078692]|uniref:2'-5' RNA ligase family protein n=1 Tax=Specibacter sp. NPDC078692 TaxID=3155818 RepID=UPI00343585DF